MSPRELEVLARHIAKANPPPTLHRYRRPSEWALKELGVPEVHIARIEDMNDPFEYQAPVHIDEGKLRAAFRAYAQNQLGMSAEKAEAESKAVGDVELNHFRKNLRGLWKASGLICTTSDARSNRMWAYYADCHRGICIVYSTKLPPFRLARAVNYANPNGPLDLLETLQIDPTLLSDHISCRKGAEWSFENEYRIAVGPFTDEHTRLLPIRPQLIVEVRLGTKITPEFKAKVLELVATRLPHVRVIQMGCDEAQFSLTETIIYPT